MSEDNTNFINNIKKLDSKGLYGLAAEIRKKIIKVVQKNGGHLGASLGAVELIIALHKVFESPKDKFLFDVGHQAYAHKLITGRWDEFHTLRQRHGLSGFTSRKESPHDPFGAGHAGTILSAASGIRLGLNHAGEKNAWVIAILGDGALTSGMTFEALNNIKNIKGKFLIIFNNNKMSISPTVGAISSWDYHQTKHFFELFGLNYQGPINGHSIEELEEKFNKISKLDEKVVLEITTIKGKGLNLSEQNPEKYHGIDGEINPKIPPSFTEIFGQTLIELAEKNPHIVAITAAMSSGTGLSKFKNKFPHRFFDVGISEQHAVTLAGGMATQGLKPVVAIYSTFLQRAYDQIVHDIALQNLPVVFAIDRAGIVGQDGPTHHGTFDIPALLAVPNIIIGSPSDKEDLITQLTFALTYNNCPIFLRYPREHAISLEVPRGIALKARRILKGHDVMIISLGTILKDVLSVALSLDNPEIWDARYIKPLDTALIERASEFNTVFVIEENPQPALASLISLRLSGTSTKVIPICLPSDEFISHGSRKELLTEFMNWDELKKNQ